MNRKNRFKDTGKLKNSVPYIGNGGSEDMCIFTHRFAFTITSLPKEGCFLFLTKAAPPLMLYKHPVLSERSLLVDSKGKLGLVVGRVNFDSVTGIINVANDARIKFMEKSGAMNPGVKKLIEIQTVTDPDNYAGSTKVLLDDEVVFQYLVDKKKGIV